MTNQELEQQVNDLQKTIKHLEGRLYLYEKAESWLCMELQQHMTWQEAHDLCQSLTLLGLFNKLLEHKLSTREMGVWELLDAWQKKVIYDELEVTILIKKKEDDPA